MSTHASWKGRIKGNNLESVPRLLWLLEPKIVFAHAKVMVDTDFMQSLPCMRLGAEALLTLLGICRPAAEVTMQSHNTVKACSLRATIVGEAG